MDAMFNPCQEDAPPDFEPDAGEAPEAAEAAADLEKVRSTFGAVFGCFVLLAFELYLAYLGIS